MSGREFHPLFEAVVSFSLLFGVIYVAEIIDNLKDKLTQEYRENGMRRIVPVIYTVVSGNPVFISD